MKKLFLTWTLCMIMSSLLHAQNWEWRVRGGGISADNARDIFVDANGNSYVTGTFTGTATFGALPSIVSAGTTDIFVAKFDPSGIPLWVRRAGGNHSSGETATGIWVNTGSGECRITGGFYGTASFGTNNVMSAGGSDIYVARYNSVTGAELGVVRFGTAAQNEFGDKITMDSGNNSYVAGHIFGTTTFGAYTATGNIFAVKLNAAGTPAWARGGVLNGGSVNVRDVRIDTWNGRFYWYGDFQGANPSLTIGSLIFGAPPDAGAFYLACLNPTTGADIWSRGGLSDDACMGDAMDLDVNNEVVITGNSTNPIWLGATTATGGRFIARLNYLGNYLLGVIVGPQATVYDMDTDCKANIYITGMFSGSYTFAGLPAMTSAGNYDLFVTKFNSSATGVWTRRAGSTGFDDGYGIGLDNSANVYVTGSFSGNAAFPPLTPITSAGNTDVFVARIPFAIHPIVSNVTICNGVDAVTLTVTNPQTGYTYNWYTAATGGTPIATGISFTTPYLTSTTTYYVAASHPDFCASLRIPVTVTVNNSCCTSSLQVSVLQTNGSGTNNPYEYTITITNPGSVAITVNNLVSVPSTPNLNGITVTPAIPSITIPGGQTVTVLVTGQYTTENTTGFDKCFVVSAGGCNYQTCVNTIVDDGGMGIEEADFMVNNNNYVNTSQPVQIVAAVPSGYHLWFAKPIGGTYVSIGGPGPAIYYAFPSPGSYMVKHTVGAYTVEKNVLVTGENIALDIDDDMPIIIPHHSDYFSGDYTLEAYVKPRYFYSASCFFSKMDNAYEDGVEFGVNSSGQLYANLNSTIYTSTGIALSAGTCAHVALTKSGTTYTFYLNGVVNGTFSYLYGNGSNSGDLYLASRAGTGTAPDGTMNGYLEEARIWNVARTQSQISSNRYLTLTGGETGLIGYWPIKEGSYSSIMDYTYNQNDGQLDEGITWTTMTCGGLRTSEESISSVAHHAHNTEVFPVPFEDETTLRLSSISQTVDLIITDVMGKVVTEVKAVKTNADYKIGKDLPIGMYIVTIKYDGYKEYVKIVKK